MTQHGSQVFCPKVLGKPVLPSKAARNKAMLVHPAAVLAFDKQPAFKHLDENILGAELSHVQQHLKTEIGSLPLSAKRRPVGFTQTWKSRTGEGEKAVVLYAVSWFHPLEEGLVTYRGSDPVVNGEAFHGLRPMPGVIDTQGYKKIRV